MTAQTTPIRMDGPHTLMLRSEKESPTARASMLVATARMNSLRPLVGSAEQLSPSSESSPPPRIMLPPIHASSAKAIQ